MRFSVLINYLALPIVLILLLFLYLATRPSPEQEVTFPESIYRFAFDSFEEEAIFVRLLQDQGFSGVLGWSSVRISLSDTFRPQRVSLQRLTELLPEDPRRTPYITYLESMLLPNNQPQVFVPPQPQSLEAVDQMLEIYRLVTNQTLEIPEPRPWLEMLIVGILSLLLLLLWTPSLTHGLITKGLSLIFLGILIQEPGPKLFLIPALLGIWGSFYTHLEQSLYSTSRKGVWFRYKSMDFLSFVWIIFADSWKLFVTTSFTSQKAKGVFWAALLILPLVGLGFVLEPQALLVIFAYWLILTLGLVIYGTLLSYQISKRLHPHFDYISLYKPESGSSWRKLGVVFLVITLYGFLGYVSVEYQAIQRQPLDFQTLQDYSLAHNFFQEWFGFGIDLADVEDGFHLMVDRFFLDSQGFIHSRESVIEFSDWVTTWKPYEYDPAYLLGYVDAGRSLWVVSVPDLGIYSRRTGVLELVMWGIIMAFISVIVRGFFSKALAGQ